jgi:GNAT superfamily N-acetyltransferase
LVAEVQAQVLGYVVVHWIPFPMIGGTEGYVSDLIVERDARGAGVGSRLIARIEALARERGCHRLMLNNRVTSESFRREFYPKRGFRRRDDFAGFVKTLNSDPPTC